MGKLFPALLPLAMSASFTCMGADYRLEANIHYDRRYAQTVLDILQPQAPALKYRPGVIVIHGGGWVRGDKEEMVDQFCAPYVQRGFVVANVEYRLAGAAPAPAAVNDVLKAAQWFHDHAADYKVDTKQIIATGTSAGAHLALLVGMLPASAGFGPETKVAAIINLSGMPDVADLIAGPGASPDVSTWIPDQPDRMELAHRLSPFTYVRKALPPVLTIHGDSDDIVPIDQSIRLTKALKDQRSDAELITVPGGKHAFTPEQFSTIYPKIFAWLKKHKIS